MLNERSRAAYHLQQYGGNPPFEGLEIVELRRFHDDGGSMTELGRLEAGMHRDLAGFEAKQVNYSEMDPGAIKAFHLHRHQTDVWFVPPASKVLLVLGDVRKGSATENEVRRIVLGDGDSRLIRIPPGVAHGCRNLGPCRAQIIYFVDRHFDPAPEDCDEGRLPWDFFGAEIWEVERA